MPRERATGFFLALHRVMCFYFFLGEHVLKGQMAQHKTHVVVLFYTTKTIKNWVLNNVRDISGGGLRPGAALLVPGLRRRRRAVNGRGRRGRFAGRGGPVHQWAPRPGSQYQDTWTQGHLVFRRPKQIACKMDPPKSETNRETAKGWESRVL